MTKIVKYFQDGFDYPEGPFVVCVHNSPHCRVEVELKGHKTSVLPDASIYQLMDQYKLIHNGSKEEVSKTVDKLNLMSKNGFIVLNGRVWMSAEAAQII